MDQFRLEINNFSSPYLYENEFRSGAKLGILKDNGPIHEKGTAKLFKDDMAFECCFTDS